jgi:cysteine synthase
MEQTMTPFDLPTEVVDATVRDRAVSHLRDRRVVLPLLSELAEPATIPDAIQGHLKSVDALSPSAANLFRVHWFNDAGRHGTKAVPDHMVLPESLTGVKARIVVALGENFPMIAAHKVLAAYGCLVPRLVSGQFDPTSQRAVWPSTGNYCRGGLAISRIMGCQGMAVLPEGMSRERFEWLEAWAAKPSDILRTPGSESNVKEVYDKCAELAVDETNVILNQFSEFGNYLIHYLCTGRALEAIFEQLRENAPDLGLAAFVSGTGSAGTLAAGDYLKTRQGSKIVVVEPTECPTMLYGGYGEHNIQGIGDKHIPLIQNVMNGDMIVGVSDESCDALNLLFNSEQGRAFLNDRKEFDPAFVHRLGSFGLSSIANVLAAIKTARRLELSENDVIVTVATDGATLYTSERENWARDRFAGGFDQLDAAEVYGRHLAGIDGDHVLELDHRERRRIFNLGYFTWVEQRGVPLDVFDARKDQRTWRELRAVLPLWDEMIADFNGRTGVNLPA